MFPTEVGNRTKPNMTTLKLYLVCKHFWLSNADRLSSVIVVMFWGFFHTRTIMIAITVLGEAITVVHK